MDVAKNHQKMVHGGQGVKTGITPKRNICEPFMRVDGGGFLRSSQKNSRARVQGKDESVWKLRCNKGEGEG